MWKGKPLEEGLQVKQSEQTTTKISGKGSYKGKPRQTLHSLEEQEMPTMPASPNVSQLYFDAVVINDIMEKGQATLEVQVNTGEQATPLRCKVDTGAEGNVIPVDTYNRIFPQHPATQLVPRLVYHHQQQQLQLAEAREYHIMDLVSST